MHPDTTTTPTSLQLSPNASLLGVTLAANNFSPAVLSQSQPQPSLGLGMVGGGGGIPQLQLPPPPASPPISAWGSGDFGSARGGRPGDHKARLAALFKEIEREFDALYEENQILRHRLGLSDNAPLPSYSQTIAHRNTLDNLKKKINLKSRLPTQKVSCTWSVLHRYPSHRDGIWEISSCPWDPVVFATASVDRTVRIRNAETGQSMVYYGHKGSVNSIRFRPGERLACTASGDCQCHIIRVPLSFEVKPHVRSSFSVVSPPTPQRRQRTATLPLGKNYDDGFPHPEASLTPSLTTSPLQQPTELDDAEQLPPLQQSPETSDMVARSPQQELKGHTGPVIACDFVGDNKLISASWDNTIRLWSITGECLHTTSNLEGLDEYIHITNITTLPGSQLVIATSSDGYCRIFDIRLPSPSISQHAPYASAVEFFQAHSDTCTSGVLTTDAVTLVTSGFDKSFKIWDLRNTKSPRNTFRGSTAVSRFTVSPNGRFIVPRDEKSATIFDINSVSSARLAKASTNFAAYSGLVNSVTWASDREESVVYTVSGFDTTVLAWGPDDQQQQQQIATPRKLPSSGSL
ncbi:WD repeat domain 37 [Pelomyxa schiedti]|nr:WD repeat domain 37 [Pelomyxa schiedti]